MMLYKMRVILVLILFVAGFAIIYFSTEKTEVSESGSPTTRFNPFTDSSKEVIACIKEAIGSENYEEIVKDKPRQPTDEEIKVTVDCAEQETTSSQAQTSQEQPSEEPQSQEQQDSRYTHPKNYSKTVFIDKEIILDGNDEMTIEDAHYIFRNDIVLEDNAKLIVRNAFIDHHKDYADQYSLNAHGNSQVILEDVELRNECTGGFGWSFHDQSSFSVDRVQQKDCNIWVLTTDSASTSINGWDWFGGTTCDEASLVVENSENLEIELCNTPGVDIDVDLPVVINQYEFSGRTVPGIKNSIILRNVTLDGWGPGAYYGTGVTVRNGNAVTISFSIRSDYTGKTVVLENLGRKHYDDAIWEFEEGYIHLVNTTTYGWEPMADGTDHKLIIRNSNFTGPTFTGGNSKVIVENSTFGAAKATEFVEIEIKDSVITDSIIARDDGKIVIRNSKLAGVSYGDNFEPVRITARDNGIIEIFNTPLGESIVLEEVNGKIYVDGVRFQSSG